MQYYVYGLIDPRNQELRYIGQTDNLERRLKEHLRSKSKTHRTHWINQLKTLGIKPEMFVIEAHDTFEEVLQAEIDLIAYYRFLGCNLTNATDGGEGSSGRIFSNETLEKMSRAKKGQPSAFKGRKHTEETKAKISAAKKGQPGGHAGIKHTDETKAKISAAKIGRKASEEERARMSISQRGRKHTDETKAKMSASQKGRECSDKTRAKLSKSAKERKREKHSEETKAKMSAAQQLRRQKESDIAMLEDQTPITTHFNDNGNH